MNEFDTFTLYEKLLSKEELTELEELIFSFLDVKYKNYNKWPDLQLSIWSLLSWDLEAFLKDNIEKVLPLMREDKSSYIVERYLRAFYSPYIPTQDWANWFLREDKRVFRWPLTEAWVKMYVVFSHTYKTTDELFNFLMSEEGQEFLERKGKESSLTQLEPIRSTL